jgi:hypothetical protein
MGTKKMTEHQPDSPARQTNIVTRTAVIAQIEDRLAGRLDDAALAAWAFDRFYAQELGQEAYEAGEETIIANALDELMFDDDADFRLNQEELRALIAQLSTL